MWHAEEGLGWWMVFGGVMMVIFWGAVIGLIVWAVGKTTGRRDSEEGTRGRRDALDIAKERYARGEITREDFEQMKRDLS
jgi:putative membrane protein